LKIHLDFTLMNDDDIAQRGSAAGGIAALSRTRTG